MADMKAEFRLNRAALRALSKRNGMVGAAVRNAAQTTVTRVKTNITNSGRVRTGKMRDTTRLGKFTDTGHSVTQEVVGPQPYTVYQERGTRHGIRPARFFDRALRQLKPSDFRPN